MAELTDKMKMVLGETRVKLIIGNVIGMYNYIHLFGEKNRMWKGGRWRNGELYYNCAF